MLVKKSKARGNILRKSSCVKNFFINVASKISNIILNILKIMLLIMFIEFVLFLLFLRKIYLHIHVKIFNVADIC